MVDREVPGSRESQKLMSGHTQKISANEVLWVTGRSGAAAGFEVMEANAVPGSEEGAITRSSSECSGNE